MRTVCIPADFLIAVANLRIPADADEQMQRLMDRNNDGLLNTDERNLLESLVEMSEVLGLLRAKALSLLAGQST
jgi:hypothetical protein